MKTYFFAHPVAGVGGITTWFCLTIWIIHLQSPANVFQPTIITSLQHHNQSLIHNAMAGSYSACANNILAADRIVKCQGCCNSEFHFSCSELSEELSATIESCAQLFWASKACVKFHKDPRTAVLRSSTLYTHTSVDLLSSIADLKVRLRNELSQQITDN